MGTRIARRRVRLLSHLAMHSLKVFGDCTRGGNRLGLRLTGLVCIFAYGDKLRPGFGRGDSSVWRLE